MPASAKTTTEISAAGTKTAKNIVGTEVEKLYTFTVSEEVLAELRMVMDRWRERYLDKNMKSLEILESVKDIC